MLHDAEKGWPAGLDLSRFDTLLVVDTGTWSQLPGLKEKLAGWNGPKLVIDHHLTQESWADRKLVMTDAAAAGEIVAELLDRWGIPLDKPMAAALYLAIVTDTGWFQFSNTRPYTLHLAARLMEYGVDTDRMYQSIYQNKRSQRLALQTQAQQSLELLEGGRLAVMRIARDDFARTGALGRRNRATDQHPVAGGQRRSVGAAGRTARRRADSREPARQRALSMYRGSPRDWRRRARAGGGVENERPTG